MNLASALDKPVLSSRPESAAISQNQPPVQSYTIPGRETKATKQAMLASNDPISGRSTLETYNRVRPAESAEVVDLTLKNLPKNADVIGVKKLAGVKHVISASVEEDNMKGVCTGAGRIQVRLNPGETVEQVELNFAKQGILVGQAKSDPRKRPNMTGAPKEFAREITNTKS